MRTDLKIKSVDSSANTKTTTISYVNAEATLNQTLAFLNLIGGLTTNQIKSAQKVTTEDIDLTPTPTKTLPEITWGLDGISTTTSNSLSVTWEQLTQSSDIKFMISEESEESVESMFTVSQESTLTNITYSTRYDFNAATIELTIADESTAQSGTMTFSLTGQNGYISEIRTLSITEGE